MTCLLIGGLTPPRSSSCGPPPGPLRCVEINPAAEAPFLKSRSRLLLRQAAGGGASAPTVPSTSPPSIQYVVAAAGADPLTHLEGAEVVIVDPPRKGLEGGLLSALINAVRQGTGGRDRDPGHSMTVMEGARSRQDREFSCM